MADITPSGFSFHQIPRTGRCGGGVGLYISDSFTFSQIDIPSHSSFEAICGRLTNPKLALDFNILNLYRPPRFNASFLNDFQDVLSYLVCLPQKLIVVGDFSIHIDKPSHATTAFLETLSSFNLQQHVNFPTHIHGHFLDLIICSDDFGLVSSFPSDFISDHCTVVAELDIIHPPQTSTTSVSYRNLNAIDIDAFKQDILDSPLCTDPANNATDSVSQYNDELRKILDRHAPLKMKIINPKPPNPWLTPGILQAKRHRRYLERAWRKNPTALNRSRFTKQIHLCNRLMAKAKSAYFSQLIHDHSSNPRCLWKCFNQVLSRRPRKLLPDSSSLSRLAEEFGFFFINKISRIRSSFNVPHTSCPLKQPKRLVSTFLGNFSPISEAEVLKLIKNAPAKSCDLDPIPILSY